MKNRKKESLLMLFVAMLLAGWQIQATQTTYTVSADSKMWVEGTSTLHDWACYATEIDGSIELDAPVDAVPSVTRAQVTVPIGTMDCHNGTMDGKLKKGERIRMLSNNSTHHVDRIGVFRPEMTVIDELGPGEIGFLTASIKQVRDTRVGDTITHEK